MKKLKIVLLGLLLSISLFGIEYKDIPKEHWAREAIEKLYYNKIFNNEILNLEEFDGEKNITRYEAAFMIYSNINLIEKNMLEKASKEELELLKRLTYEFAPELQNLGANIYDLSKKIEELEEITKKNSKLEDRIVKIEDYFKMLELHGDIEVNQTAEYKNDDAGIKDIQYDANLYIKLKPMKHIQVNSRIKAQNLNKDEIILDGIEFRTTLKDLKIIAFKDETKKGLNFNNSLNIFDWEKIKPSEGLIFSGNYNIMKKNKLGYRGTISKNDNNDIYGLEMDVTFDYFKEKNIDNKFTLAYSEIISDYKKDNQDTNKYNSKALYLLSSRLSYDEFEYINLNMEMEYAFRKGPEVNEMSAESREYMPFFGNMIKSNDAIHIYTYGKLKRKLGISFSGGIYNSGEFFDIEYLGDEKRELFSETSLIKSEKDKKGVMGKLKYDYKEKNNITTELIYASYGNNIKDVNPSSELVFLNTWNAIKGNKLKFELEYKIEKDENMYLNLDEENLKGKYSYELRTKNKVLLKNSEQNISFRYTDNKDVEDYKDIEKSYRIYLDNEIKFNKAIYLKTAAAYSKNGLDLENRPDYVFNGNDWEKRENDYKAEMNDKIEFALGLEITPENKGKINVGAYISSINKKGGYNEITQENTKKRDDKLDYHLFAAHKYKRGRWTLNYGAKYHIEKVGAASKDYKEYALKDLDKKNGGLNDVSYALGIEYELKRDTIISIKYGTPELKDSNDFMYDSMSYADGEQDIFTAKFKTKF